MSQSVQTLPHSVSEGHALRTMVGAVHDFPLMSFEEQNHLLKKFESFECYSQLVQLLLWRLENSSTAPHSRIFMDYLWVMRIHYLGLESFDGFVEAAKTCITRLKIPFSMIRIHCADEILGVENFFEQAKFFSEILNSFEDNSQKVLLLERLALIKEKKLFSEYEIEPLFRHITQLDPKNRKALKFFKFWYLNSGQPELAAKQLQTLMETAPNPHEQQRAAHELAQLYLYNLSEPEKARNILIRYCENSQIDTRRLLTEVLERLELYDDLLMSLAEAEKLVKDPQTLAQIKLKEGTVCLKANQPREAIIHLKESIKLFPGQLQAYEALINALITTEKLDEVPLILEDMNNYVIQDSNKKSIERIVVRAQNLANRGALIPKRNT